MTDSVCIVGLGLIGGSLGMALRRAGWHVAYVDPGVPLAAARDAAAADERLDAAAGSLIVLATPLDTAMEHLAALQKSGALVTSVCSLMRPLCDRAGSVQLVAGHPFAGSERRGLAAADAALFADRPWFLSGPNALVERMASEAGARPRVIDASEHDRIMALTSHLPQLVSTALASLLRDVPTELIGSGAASMLRLAGSAYEVWRPVLEGNRSNLDEAVDALLTRMRAMSADDFTAANETHTRLTH